MRADVDARRNDIVTLATMKEVGAPARATSLSSIEQATMVSRYTGHDFNTRFTHVSPGKIG